MADIVIDGPTSELNLGRGTWKVSTTGWFGGSAVYPAFAVGTSGDTGQYGTLSMPLQGGYLIYDTNNQHL